MYSGIEIKTEGNWFQNNKAIGLGLEPKSQSYKNRASLLTGFLPSIAALALKGFTEFSRIFDL
ncbi:hypothetical protein TH63_02950 [Rufibacter radiotolerans]|uniref:Uncharacterized protein n=1 Tax=Rufibacter radiotolerans TaxID=1379910 RepID=A0A0H4VM42_9BACT|nr:hypothetical protein TH63_02950 [Rufibacter radiotolerans]